MPVIDIDHIALRTADLDATVAFWNDVLGTTSAPRPEFGFPGAWLKMGQTMIHLYGGDAAKNSDGIVERGGAAVDHIALAARGFDAMRASLESRGLDWREQDIPSIALWQLFVRDPNGVLVEMNFKTADEPDGSAGPNGARQYKPGNI